MELSWLKDHLGKSLFVALTLFALTFSAYKIGETHAWLTGILSLIALALILWVYRKTDTGENKDELQSDEWFKLIVELLDDSSSAKIYLREFKHPDEFKETHRSDLLKIMKVFAKKIVEHNDHFRIVAYRRSDSKDKNPIEWLKHEIATSYGINKVGKLVNKCVTVINSQPAENASTLYLIDNAFLFYNRLSDDHQMKYYKVDISRSIIPYFFDLGFASFFNSMSRKS